MIKSKDVLGCFDGLGWTGVFLTTFKVACRCISIWDQWEGMCCSMVEETCHLWFQMFQLLDSQTFLYKKYLLNLPAQELWLPQVLPRQICKGRSASYLSGELSSLCLQSVTLPMEVEACGPACLFFFFLLFFLLTYNSSPRGLNKEQTRAQGHMSCAEDLHQLFTTFPSLLPTLA